MVMLGAAAPFLGLNKEKLEQSVKNLFSRKGEDIINMNLEAFRKGYQFAIDHS